MSGWTGGEGCAGPAAMRRSLNLPLCDASLTSKWHDKRRPMWKSAGKAFCKGGGKAESGLQLQRPSANGGSNDKRHLSRGRAQHPPLCRTFSFPKHQLKQRGFRVSHCPLSQARDKRLIIDSALCFDQSPASLSLCFLCSWNCSYKQDYVARIGCVFLNKKQFIKKNVD